MPSKASLQKQISMYLPLDEWKAVRLEAAKRNQPITALIRRWIRRPIANVVRRNTSAGTT
jgi:hypothetical protein